MRAAAQFALVAATFYVVGVAAVSLAQPLHVAVNRWVMR
jgi:hypothetical protein